MEFSLRKILWKTRFASLCEVFKINSSATTLLHITPNKPSTSLLFEKTVDEIKQTIISKLAITSVGKEQVV